MKMDKKTKQRLEDIRECSGWDSETDALTESWNRGYDFCKIQMKNNFIDFLFHVEESLEEIFRNNDFCGKEWATIKLKKEELINEVENGSKI